MGLVRGCKYYLGPKAILVLGELREEIGIKVDASCSAPMSR